MAGGASGEFALARYLSDGTLDPSFGDEGKVTTLFTEGEAYAGSVVIQADGKIVVAGLAADGFALARYLSDGTLDSSFGDEGKVATAFGGTGTLAPGLALRANGKIVVVGTANRKFALATYNTDGTLDSSFGNEGKVTTDFTTGLDYAIAAANEVGGKIVVVGRAGYRGFALARYRRNGALDPSFGEKGKVRTFFGPDYIRASADDVAIQADGRIVAAGWAGHNYVHFALARYETDGTLDSSFGRNGKLRTDIGRNAEAAEGVAIQANGKIVAAGMAGYFRKFAVARYKPDGTLDSSFGNGGRVTTSFGAGDVVAWGLALQANGMIVTAGQAGGAFAVGRYLAA